MNKTAYKSRGKQTKKRKGIVSMTAVAHVLSTYNNTIVTVSDLNGDTIASCSGGVCQKGSRKSTPHAAQEAGKRVGTVVKDIGVDELRVILRGTGSGRDSAVRGLNSAGLKILTIADKTKVPHGGVRKRKKRRV
ncbi:MAG: 30S ribosomal protein S11 [Pseudomonadota bacterium]|nr:30S ribosomal protein S11 [Pseudomonadota bacterium]